MHLMFFLLGVYTLVKALALCILVLAKWTGFFWFVRENRGRPPFGKMTAILLVSSFRLAAISRFKYLYASFKTGSFLKVTETGYIHGVEIYGAIDIQVT